MSLSRRCRRRQNVLRPRRLISNKSKILAFCNFSTTVWVCSSCVFYWVSLLVEAVRVSFMVMYSSCIALSQWKLILHTFPEHIFGYEKKVMIKARLVDEV